MSPRLKGYLAAFTAIALWASTGLFIRYLVADEAMPPLLLAWWRNIIISIALGLVFWLPRETSLPRGQGRFLTFYGLVLALFNAVWIASVGANGAAVATVLLYSSTAFTALIGKWRFGESLGLAKAAAVAASLAGCALVAGAYTPAAWHLHAAGGMLGLLSGALFAAYSLLGKAAAQRGLPPWRTLFFTFGIASVFLTLPEALSAARTPQGVAALLPHLTAWGWGVLLFLAIGPTLLGFVFYNMALGLLPAGVVNLLATTEPVMTAAAAYIFLGERLTAPQILGAVLVLGGVLLVQMEKSPAPSNLTASTTL